MQKEVLYVCIGNACRSIMAEALTKHHWAGRYEAASAGIDPLGIVPKTTLEVLRLHGVQVEGLYSKHIRDLYLNRFDLIVNLSGYSLQPFVFAARNIRIVNCQVYDPFGQSLEVYQQALKAIEKMVVKKVPKWLEGKK